MMTDAQERVELMAFLRNALAYFDSAAEGVHPKQDPAALFSEGKVVLLRMERECR